MLSPSDGRGAGGGSFRSGTGGRGRKYYVKLFSPSRYNRNFFFCFSNFYFITLYSVSFHFFPPSRMSNQEYTRGVAGNAPVVEWNWYLFSYLKIIHILLIHIYNHTIWVDDVLRPLRIGSPRARYIRQTLCRHPHQRPTRPATTGFCSFRVSYT